MKRGGLFLRYDHTFATRAGLIPFTAYANFRDVQISGLRLYRIVSHGSVNIIGGSVYIKSSFAFTKNKQDSIPARQKRNL